MDISNNIRLMTIIVIFATLITFTTSTMYANAYRFTFSTADFSQTFSINTDNIELAKGIGEQFAIVQLNDLLPNIDLGENLTTGLTPSDVNTFVQKDIGNSVDKLVAISESLQANQTSTAVGNTTDTSGITIIDDSAAGIFVSIDME